MFPSPFLLMRQPVGVISDYGLHVTTEFARWVVSFLSLGRFRCFFGGLGFGFFEGFLSFLLSLLDTVAAFVFAFTGHISLRHICRHFSSPFLSAN